MVFISILLLSIFKEQRTCLRAILGFKCAFWYFLPPYSPKVMQNTWIYPPTIPLIAINYTWKRNSNTFICRLLASLQGGNWSKVLVNYQTIVTPLRSCCKMQEEATLFLPFTFQKFNFHVHFKYLFGSGVAHWEVTKPVTLF